MSTFEVVLALFGNAYELSSLGRRDGCSKAHYGLREEVKSGERRHRKCSCLHVKTIFFLSSR